MCAALFGNLGGVTSGLLALDGGQLAGRARLDVIVPVDGFKRCADYDNSYGAVERGMSSACRAMLQGCAVLDMHKTTQRRCFHLTHAVRHVAVSSEIVGND